MIRNIHSSASVSCFQRKSVGESKGSALCQMDTLCSARSGKFQLLSFAKRVYRSFADLWQSALVFFSRLICCLAKSSPSLLELYEKNLTTIAKLPLYFANKNKTLSEPALKKWWHSQFYALPLKIQELLLLEYVICGAPENGDKRGWAVANFGKSKTLAVEFVVRLNHETLGGKTITPIQVVPRLLQELHTYLGLEIERLHQEKK